MLRMLYAISHMHTGTPLFKILDPPLGNIVHVDVYALTVSCVVGCYNAAVTTKHGRYGLSCMQKLWSAQVVPSLYGMLVLLNVANILYAGRLVCRKLVSE